MSTETLSQLRAGRLAGIRRLDLSCGLTDFPEEIFDLADSLEILDLSGNQLSSLPADLHRLHRLHTVFCSDNRFTELPAVLGSCPGLGMVGFKANQIRHVPAAALPPQLRWLILTDNQIEHLPEALGHRPRLQKLMLAGNRLRSLPASLATCAQLELLRISANDLDAFPPWLAALPRLAWLAYAGNPFCAAWQAAGAPPQAPPVVDWSQLTPGPRLGEGASGVIHRATLFHGKDEKFVAIKTFKGAVTSDGFPQSEMAACIAAGRHAGLVGIEGVIAGHPQGCQGLVMRLIDPSYSVLAGPPSLESCTRDIYAEGLRLGARTALAMATGIAAATAHLHARGILHGDLYAHNILWNGLCDALLGDFGAASFFDPDDDARAPQLQRIEARAFGCLLEELLDRCHRRPDDAPMLQVLDDLRARCLAQHVGSRPLFGEIHDQLAAIDITNG